MRILVLLAFAGLQSCTPVFAQGDASRGSPHTEDKAAQEHGKKVRKKAKEVQRSLEGKEEKPKKDDDKISTSDTDKAVFEKKPNEPGTWQSIKETTDVVLDEAGDVAADTTQTIGRTLGAARLRRQDTTWTLAANYSLFEMWTMSKYGLTVGYNRSASTTFEFDYMRGSLGFGKFGFDIGELSEDRFGLNWRTYGQRNSFSFVTGLYYNRLSIHLGSDLMSKVARIPKLNLLELETVGLHWGIGNRWQTKGGFVWGADWLAVNIPVFILKQRHPFVDATPDANDREDAQDAMKILRRIPEIAIVKAQIGFSF